MLRLSGFRPGDGAQLALLEFSAVIEAPEKPKKIKKEKKPVPPKAEEVKAEKVEAKKEPEKKGGFLRALRRFFTGKEE